MESRLVVGGAPREVVSRVVHDDTRRPGALDDARLMLRLGPCVVHSPGLLGRLPRRNPVCDLSGLRLVVMSSHLVLPGFTCAGSGPSTLSSRVIEVSPVPLQARSTGDWQLLELAAWPAACFGMHPIIAPSTSLEPAVRGAVAGVETASKLNFIQWCRRSLAPNALTWVSAMAIPSKRLAPASMKALALGPSAVSLS